MTASIHAGVQQCASCVLLVRPARFGYNSQTADSNHFQHSAATSGPIAARARAEFDRLREGLQAAGVRVCVVEDTSEPAKPDAVFPNNWVSWHHDGTIVLYPMQAPNRRTERRQEILNVAAAQSGFQRRRLIDLSAHELQARFLEGTGSLVLDHVEKVAYACRSVRTDATVLYEWARLMDYEPLLFDALGSDATPLYHTNVMLSIGTHWAVVCTTAIVPADRVRVLGRLASSGRAVIEIDLSAVQAFAGNLLELAGAEVGGRARRVLALSACARAALSERGSWERLSHSVDVVVAVAVPTIEAVGGGSVRCMLAEIPAVSA